MSRGTVFLVEDDSELLQLMRIRLESHNIKVLSTERSITPIGNVSRGCYTTKPPPVFQIFRKTGGGSTYIICPIFFPRTSELEHPF